MKKDKFDFGGWATKNDLLCADGRTIRRNAFKDDDGRKVPLVYQHNHEDPRRVIGHALLENKDDGVFAWCSLNNTDVGRHVKECVRHGDLQGLSIYANKLTQRGGDVLHGTIRELSIVLAGANPGAVIEFPMLEHGEESETEAYIWCGDEEMVYSDSLEIAHSEDTGDAGESNDDDARQVMRQIASGETDEALEHADDDKNEKSGEFNETEESKSDDSLEHADDNKSSEKDSKEEESDDDETIQDVLDTLNDEQKAVVDFVIDQAISGKDFKMEGKEAEETKPAKGEKSVADVLKTLSEKQMNVVEFLLEQAQEAAKSADEDAKKASHSALNGDEELSHTDEGEEIIMSNVFDKTDVNKTQENVLTHAQMDVLIKDAKKLGTMSASVLEHSAEYGIDQIDYLMPEYREVSGNGAPQFIKRDMKWVTKVMQGVHHIPFSKFKTTFADLTEDEARARGYITGHRKKEEVFGLLRRTTDATTVYKKQKMDRDNAIEITSFDVIAWLKGEMRMMLDEELARAFLIGDGRDASSEDKINELNIRPVLRDDSLFVIRQPIEAGEGQSHADALIDAVTYGWENYQGSGNCVAFMTRREFSNLKLLKDKMGRRIYETDSAIASALGVREIAFVPQMGDASSVRVDGNKTWKPAVIILDLDDYTVGADKGGSINMFEDFDIDYNQMKYLIETRCSGALVKPYSAIVVEELVNP